MSDLLFDPDELAAAEALVICVPGALSSKDIFDPVRAWADHGYGLVFYRFPGLDGRPISPPLSIEKAAEDIVELVAQYPGKPVRLLGYSTGGPIVISAATRLTGDIKVATMSTAVEGGGGLRSGLLGLSDVLSAAGRKLSISTADIWMEYYRVLLFGREVLHNDALAAQADALIAGHKPKIVMPDGGKPRAHTDNLRAWRLPNGARFSRGQMQFFVGLADPVFSKEQTMRFAQKCGDVCVVGYPGQGHLLFLSCPTIFDDVLDFFENRSCSSPEYQQIA